MTNTKWNDTINLQNESQEIEFFCQNGQICKHKKHRVDLMVMFIKNGIKTVHIIVSRLLS